MGIQAEIKIIAFILSGGKTKGDEVTIGPSDVLKKTEEYIGKKNILNYDNELQANTKIENHVAENSQELLGDILKSAKNTEGTDFDIFSKTMEYKEESEELKEEFKEEKAKDKKFYVTESNVQSKENIELIEEKERQEQEIEDKREEIIETILGGPQYDTGEDTLIKMGKAAYTTGKEASNTAAAVLGQIPKVGWIFSGTIGLCSFLIFDVYLSMILPAIPALIRALSILIQWATRKTFEIFSGKLKLSNRLETIQTVLESEYLKKKMLVDDESTRLLYLQTYIHKYEEKNPYEDELKFKLKNLKDRILKITKAFKLIQSECYITTSDKYQDIVDKLRTIYLSKDKSKWDTHENFLFEWATDEFEYQAMDRDKFIKKLNTGWIPESESEMRKFNIISTHEMDNILLTQVFKTDITLSNINKNIKNNLSGGGRKKKKQRKETVKTRKSGDTKESHKREKPIDSRTKKKAHRSREKRNKTIRRGHRQVGGKRTWFQKKWRNFKKKANWKALIVVTIILSFALLSVVTDMDLEHGPLTSHAHYEQDPTDGHHWSYPTAPGGGDIIGHTDSNGQFDPFGFTAHSVFAVTYSDDGPHREVSTTNLSPDFVTWWNELFPGTNDWEFDDTPPHTQEEFMRKLEALHQEIMAQRREGGTEVAREWLQRHLVSDDDEDRGTERIPRALATWLGMGDEGYGGIHFSESDQVGDNADNLWGGITASYHAQMNDRAMGMGGDGGGFFDGAQADFSDICWFWNDCSTNLLSNTQNKYSFLFWLKCKIMVALDFHAVYVPEVLDDDGTVKTAAHYNWVPGVPPSLTVNSMIITNPVHPGQVWVPGPDSGPELAPEYVPPSPDYRNTIPMLLGKHGHWVPFDESPYALDADGHKLEAFEKIAMDQVAVNRINDGSTSYFAPEDVSTDTRVRIGDDEYPLVGDQSWLQLGTNNDDIESFTVYNDSPIANPTKYLTFNPTWLQDRWLASGHTDICPLIQSQGSDDTLGFWSPSQMRNLLPGGTIGGASNARDPLYGSTDDRAGWFESGSTIRSGIHSGQSARAGSVWGGTPMMNAIQGERMPDWSFREVRADGGFRQHHHLLGRGNTPDGLSPTRSNFIYGVALAEQHGGRGDPTATHGSQAQWFYNQGGSHGGPRGGPEEGSFIDNPSNPFRYGLPTFSGEDGDVTMDFKTGIIQNDDINFADREKWVNAAHTSTIGVNDDECDLEDMWGGRCYRNNPNPFVCSDTDRSIYCTTLYRYGPNAPEGDVGRVCTPGSDDHCSYIGVSAQNPHATSEAPDTDPPLPAEFSSDGDCIKNCPVDWRDMGSGITHSDTSADIGNTVLYLFKEKMAIFLDCLISGGSDCWIDQVSNSFGEIITTIKNIILYSMCGKDIPGLSVLRDEEWDHPNSGLDGGDCYDSDTSGASIINFFVKMVAHVLDFGQTITVGIFEFIVSIMIGGTATVLGGFIDLFIEQDLQWAGWVGLGLFGTYNVLKAAYDRYMQDTFYSSITKTIKQKYIDVDQMIIDGASPEEINEEKVKISEMMKEWDDALEVNKEDFITAFNERIQISNYNNVLWAILSNDPGLSYDNALIKTENIIRIAKKNLNLDNDIEDIYLFRNECKKLIRQFDLSFIPSVISSRAPK